MECSEGKKRGGVGAEAFCGARNLELYAEFAPLPQPLRPRRKPQSSSVRRLQQISAVQTQAKVYSPLLSLR
jgi:hypothetical protein